MEFTAFPKIPRLNRPFVITEKIDGTNGAIVINEYDDGSAPPNTHERAVAWALINGKIVVVGAQSRKRLITPNDDHFNLAAWVKSHAFELYEALGPGVHYGEWAGPGIQKNPHNLVARTFFLFNTQRWTGVGFTIPGLDVVPILDVCDFSDLNLVVSNELADLERSGSHVGERPNKAEGIIVYHTAGRHIYKATIENDDTGKWAN